MAPDRGPAESTWTVSFTNTSGSLPHHVRAAYPVFNDGYVELKDSSHKVVFLAPAEQIAYVQRSDARVARAAAEQPARSAWRKFDDADPPPTGVLLWVYVPESEHNYASDRGVKLGEWDGSRFYKKVRADYADSVAREAWNWRLDASHWAIVPVPEGPVEAEAAS